jgi:phospholipid/cholesterol/gamma-HCH transport system permease protein
VDYLIVPRVSATILALPLLTAESITIGILSAYIIGVYLLGIDATYLWQNMLHYTEMTDMLTGLIKSVIFGAIIGMVGCYKGLNCREGAEGVGRATTESVVYSSITILISNFFLTMVLTRLFQGE